MEGGDRQTVSIAPGDVAAGGQYTTTRTLSGEQTGTFQVAATLMVPGVLLAAHVWNISPAPHTPNVTTPPTHWYRITFATHKPGVTWPTQSGGKWTDHTPNVSFGPPGTAHVPAESWPHVAGVTRWQHYEGVTYDGPHVPRFTWPPSHTENFSFSEHVNGASFPPHQQSGSWAPRHQERVSWPPTHKDAVTWPPEHKSNYSWPQNHQASTTNWSGPPYQQGVPKAP
jgi:hypothetical protein